MAASEAEKLARLIRDEIIGGAAPYWYLDGELPGTTADEVRGEVRPVLSEVIRACSEVIGDGVQPYPGGPRPGTGVHERKV